MTTSLKQNDLESFAPDFPDIRKLLEQENTILHHLYGLNLRVKQLDLEFQMIVEEQERIAHDGIVDPEGSIEAELNIRGKQLAHMEEKVLYEAAQIRRQLQQTEKMFTHLNKECRSFIKDLNGRFTKES